MRLTHATMVMAAITVGLLAGLYTQAALFTGFVTFILVAILAIDDDEARADAARRNHVRRR